MSRFRLISRTFLLSLAAGAVQSFAQTPSPAPPASSPSAMSEIQEAGRAAGVLSRSTPEQLQRAETLAKEAVDAILRGYERRLPEMQRRIDPLRARSDQIASEALQAERDKVLDFLGIDPQAETGLFVFLSWSMPKELLRAYVLDAMWSGASIQFKGVPPGVKLEEFALRDLRSLVYGKAAANISIDPRLFDAYQVTQVPTIVYAANARQISCLGGPRQSFKSAEVEMSYETCPPAPQNEFWKVSGAVTMSYALEAFEERGAPGIKPYRAAIARGVPAGSVATKEQKPFSGVWEDVLSPEEWQQNEKAAQQAAGVRR